MAKIFRMSWEGAPKFRWLKMHNGKRYRVSCEELGCPPTKNESYQAANLWWERKLKELNQSRPTVPPDKAEALKDVEDKILWATNHDPELVADLKQIKKQIHTELPTEIVLTDEETINRNLEIAKLFSIEVPEDLDPSIVQHFFGDRSVWQDRFRRAGIVETNKTLKFVLDKFLELERVRMKPQSYNELKDYLLLVRDELGESLDCSTINEATIDRHYVWLASKSWQTASKNKRLGFFRRMITWLWSNRILTDVPRNLKLKSQRFKVVTKKIKTFDDIAGELKQLEPNCRLWALLGLNCGMTQADLGALTWDMIDLENKTLTRKRVKTEAKANVPVVTYKLFPETLALLKALAKTSDLVFQTEGGKPFYHTKYDEKGDPKKKDLFSTYWNRQKRKAEIPLGKYRSIGATILKKRIIYRGFVKLFLGQAPSSIDDKHYAAESDAPFFEALQFMHDEVFSKKPES